MRDDLDARRYVELTPDELDELADAAFWTDDHDRSLEVRRDAYRAHLANDDLRSAALAGWRLFYDHALIGEMAPAVGWLERTRRHVDDSGDDLAAGWLAIADADLALGDGDAPLALSHSRRARATGAAGHDVDLTAMALQAEGRALIANGDRVTGCSRLDEAMVAVIDGELTPMYTGWVYCNVVAACYAIADIRRATEWSSAAMRWSTALRDGKMYPGLCRVYSVELAYLRGDWEQALADAELACDQLMSFEPRYAGAAFGLVGDLRRVRGDLGGAAAAYRQAHALGSSPQPGLALLHVANGDMDAALQSLVSALQPSPDATLPRAFLLSALADVAATTGDDDTAARALGELADTGDGTDGLLDAIAVSARAEIALRDGRPADATASYRQAIDQLHELGFPYETARRRVRLAEVVRGAGDDTTADLELTAACATFEQLGAERDLDRARRLLDRRSPRSGLTPREQEVLARVAGGRTNNEIAADLVVSPHTIARHMTNIRTKLGVTSRAAAVAEATGRGWLRLDARHVDDGFSNG